MPVVLTRLRCGGVSGQCMLGGDERPIIDGRTVHEVIATIEDALEDLLLARGHLQGPPEGEASLRGVG